MCVLELTFQLGTTLHTCLELLLILSCDVKPLHFSVLLNALQFDVNQVVGLFLLFVLDEEQFICLKRWLFWCTVILITCPSAPLLLVIFVDCYCRCCYIFVCHFVDLFISPHQVGVPCFFSLFKLYSRYPLVSSL